MFKEKATLVIKNDLQERLKSSLDVKEAAEKIITLFKNDPSYKQNYKVYLENFIFNSYNHQNFTFEESITKFSKIIEAL